MAYKPKRIAPPSIIADAAGVLHALTDSHTRSTTTSATAGTARSSARTAS